MAGKLGMGLLETLLENLDRDLNLADTTLTNPKITTSADVSLSSANNVNRGARSTNRYYLEEYFNQMPALNAVVTQPLTDADATAAANDAIIVARGIANRSFEVSGTNMTTALVDFAPEGGITLKTAGADADQAILTPHLDTDQSAWATTAWNTAQSLEWECKIYTSAAIDNQKIWAGLKLTTDQVIATDDDQAYFKFQTDATASEAFTDFTLLHFVYSVGGTDFISALPITVEASTAYHLKISLDSDRKASIFVNGVQYNATTTAGSTGGTAVTTGTTPTPALTSLTTLNPVIGIENGDANTAQIDVGFVAMNHLR